MLGMKEMRELLWLVATVLNILLSLWYTSDARLGPRQPHQVHGQIESNSCSGSHQKKSVKAISIQLREV